MTLYISPYYLYLKCVSCLSQFCLLSCHLVYLAVLPLDESRASDQMNSCKHGWHYHSAAHDPTLIRSSDHLRSVNHRDAKPLRNQQSTCLRKWWRSELVGNSWPCISPQTYQTMKSSGCCTGQLWCRPLSLWMNVTGALSRCWCRLWVYGGSWCCCYQTVNVCFLLDFMKFPLQQLKPNSLSKI